MQELIDRLRQALAATGLERAVLSRPETRAQMCRVDPSPEERPVANPLAPSPALRVKLPVELKAIRRTPRATVAAALRAELEDLGTTCARHTGHGSGAAASEPPRITPSEQIRLEHVFVVRPGGNEIPTRFEHTL